MSKNTASTKFRSVNVDAYDEDNFEDEDVSVEASDVQACASECRKLLNASKKEDALKTVLSGAPQMSKDKAVKDQFLTVVMEVLAAVKNDEIAPIIANLSQENIDVLMKYVFRGMGNTPVNGSEIQLEEYAKLCDKLLNWHMAITKANGLGCIVRCLSDRKTV